MLTTAPVGVSCWPTTTFPKPVSKSSHGGRGGDRLDDASTAESYGEVWSEESRKPRNETSRQRGGPHIRPEPEKVIVWRHDFLQNPVLGQGHFWPRRSFAG